MSTRVTGSFSVKMIPQEPSETTKETAIGRMSLEKRYEGELAGVGRGEMLTVHGAVEGSAGYVAIERFLGTLQGRAGGFALQHNGIMNRGEPSLSVVVVPDSGSGELVGLTGRMILSNNDGEHAYEFEYELPQEA